LALSPYQFLPPQDTTAPGAFHRRSAASKKLIAFGQLDEIPVFNSNSPEMVMDEGILLDLSNAGVAFLTAHLNLRRVQGRFDVFSHHT
jgi:hypothetical protein